MGALDILVKLQESGGGAVSAVFRNVGNDAKQLGRNVDEAADKSTALDTALDKVDGEGLKETANKAKDLDKALEDSGSRADALKGRLESVRDAGLKIGAVGAVGMVLSNSLAEGFLEADRLNGKLDSLMKGKGMGDAIGQVKGLGAEIAALTGGDDDGIATAIGAAVASGRVNGLKEYGIIIDATGQASIAAAGKISAQAKQQEVLNQVMRAGKTATDNLREGLTDATISLGEMSVRWGNLEEGFGEGAAQAKAALYEGILSPIMTIIEASPGLQTSIGYIGAIGSTALGAVGGVLSLGSQVGILAMSFPTLGASALGAFSTMKAAAASTIPFLLGVAQALAVPFAILAAGVAVGVAGYELLRATGVLSNNKSAAEIFADSKKMLMGDTDADAQKAGIAAAEAEATASAAAAAAAAPLPPASASVAAQQTAPGVTTSAAGAAASAPKATKDKADNDADKAREKYLKNALELPAEVLDEAGEKNVQAEMSRAQSLFAGLEENAARKRFQAMADLFEENGGFQGEAELEAAKRVFQSKYSGEKTTGKAPTAKATKDREFGVADAMSYVRSGGNIFDLKNGAAGTSSDGVSRETDSEKQSISVQPETRSTINAAGTILTIEILPTKFEVPIGQPRARR